MKNYKYNGNLEEDIKKANKNFDVKKFIRSELLSIIIYSIISGIIIPVAGLAFKWFVICTLISTLLQTIYNVSEIIDSTKDQKKNLLENLYNLYTDINLNCSDVALAEARMKESLSESYDSGESHTYVDGKEVKTEKQITTNFYLLDPKDQLQVLRQVRNIIINGKNKEENYDLYLLEEQDLKEEKLEIPVEKALKFKAK